MAPDRIRGGIDCLKARDFYLRKSSPKNPGKQRTQALRAPLHRKKRDLSAPLSEDLRKRYKIRRLPVRRDDVVYLRIGSFKETEGKVTRINVKKQRLEIDGITREKMDGSKIFYPIHPSNVVIVRLGRLDSSRRRIIERKAKEEIEFPEEEPVEEIAEPVADELETDDELDLDAEDLEELEEDIEEEMPEEDKVRSPLPDINEEED
ncbi:MAG: 50S ribosomal protein L24 [Candidatus Hodarchaeales archaeon]